MERCCLNCKYHFCGTCNNSGIKVENINNAEKLNLLCEDGRIHMMIEDEIDIEDIEKLIIKHLTKIDAIKKTKEHKIMQEIDHDSIQANFIEIVDELICNSLIPILKNVSNNSMAKISNPREFCCSNWE